VTSAHNRLYQTLIAKVVVTRVSEMDCVMIHPVKAVSYNDSEDDASEAATVSSEDTGPAVVSSPARTPVNSR